MLKQFCVFDGTKMTQVMQMNAGFSLFNAISAQLNFLIYVHLHHLRAICFAQYLSGF